MRGLVLGVMIIGVLATTRDPHPHADASHTPGDMMSIRHSGGDPGPFGPGGSVLLLPVGAAFDAEIWIDASSAPYQGYQWKIAYDPAYLTHTGVNVELQSGTYSICDAARAVTLGAFTALEGGLCLAPGQPPQFVGHMTNVGLRCIAPTPSPVSATPVAMITLEDDAVADPNFGTTIIEPGGPLRSTSSRYKAPHALGGMIAQIAVRCLDPALDPDNDGCSNGEETGTNPLQGGKRDPFDPYDFFDVPTPALSAGMPNGTKNKAVSLVDVGGPLAYVGAVNDGMANMGGYDYDSDFNANSVEDGAEYDRTSSMIMGQPWRSGPPNGAVSLMDVGVALVQVGTNCVPPP